MFFKNSSFCLSHPHNHKCVLYNSLLKLLFIRVSTIQGVLFLFFIQNLKTVMHFLNRKKNSGNTRGIIVLHLHLNNLQHLKCFKSKYSYIYTFFQHNFGNNPFFTNSNVFQLFLQNVGGDTRTLFCVKYTSHESSYMQIIELCILSKNNAEFDV